MNRKYLTRKYIAVAFCVIGCCLKLEELANAHALYPVPWATLLIGAGTGLLLPGGIVAVLIGGVTGISVSLTVCVWLSLAFWFFPVARIERWFGTFDTVGTEGKRRFPSLIVSAAAHVLDTARRWRVGKGKSGGWA